MKRLIFGGMLCFSFAKGEDIGVILERVVGNDYKLKALIHQEKASEYRIDQVKAGYKPQLNFNSILGWDKYRPYYLNTEIEQTLRYYNLSVVQPLYNPEFFPKLNQSKIYREVASLKVKQQQEYIKAVFLDYLIGFLIKRKDVEDYRRVVQAYREKLDIFQELYTRKRITEEDLIKAKVDYRMSNLELNRIESEFESIRKVLYSMVEEEDKSKLDMFDIRDEFEVERFYREEKQWIEGLEGNFDVLIARKNVEAAKEEIYIRKSKGLPKVNLQASYLKSTTTSTSIVREDKRVVLSVDYPIYQGGLVSSMVMEGEEILKASNMEYESILKDKKREAYGLIREYLSGYEGVRSMKVVVEESKKRVGEIKEAYGKGLKSYVDVLDGEVEYLNSKIKYREQMYKFLSSYIKLSFLSSNSEYANFIKTILK